jgi:hypothetical protein
MLLPQEGEEQAVVGHTIVQYLMHIPFMVYPMANNQDCCLRHILIKHAKCYRQSG